MKDRTIMKLIYFINLTLFSSIEE